MAVIVWYLDVQLPMQSVPITTDDVSSHLDQGEVYNIMWYSLSVTFSTNKTDRHDIAKILLKVALSTTKQTNKQTSKQ